MDAVDDQWEAMVTDLCQTTGMHPDDAQDWAALGREHEWGPVQTHKFASHFATCGLLASHARMAINPRPLTHVGITMRVGVSRPRLWRRLWGRFQHHAAIAAITVTVVLAAYWILDALNVIDPK